MIKGIGSRASGERVILLGISEENVRRLRLHQPIEVDLDDLGLAGEGYIVLMWGDTERSILIELETVGIKLHDRSQ